MIKAAANIELYEGANARKTPFVSGYRPLFDFVPNMKTSGQITLLDRQQMYPGESCEVEIQFANSDYLGDDFGQGKPFLFGEGSSPLGKGVILRIL